MHTNSVLAVGAGATVSIAALLIVRSRRHLYSSLSRNVRPPVLKKRPHFVPFGKVPGRNSGPNPMEPILHLQDPYFYVRDESRENEEILSHLRKENEYTKEKMKHLQPVQDAIYKEILSHVQETDEEYPYPHGPYIYYTRTVKGSSYVIHCRKPKLGSGSEEVILDENLLAEGKDYLNITDVNVSPDHLYLSYLVDTSGMEVYTGYIKDLRTGRVLQDQLEGVHSLNWGSDSSTLFYSTQDEALRVNKIWQYRVGQNDNGKVNIYTENDELFSASFGKSRSGRYMFLGSSSSETSEVSCIDLEDQSGKVQLIAKRTKGVIYDVEHQDKYFYIVTNKDNATNFKMMRTLVTSLSPESWQDVFPYDDSVKIDDVDAFKDFMIIQGRQNGLTQLWIVKHDSDGKNGTKYTKERITFSEPLHTVYLGINEEYVTDKIRFTYSSLTTPRTVYDYTVETMERVLLKEKSVPNYDRSLYASERLFAIASDGTKVPISLVYRKDLRTKDRQPLHLYGYGSYGISIDPVFSSHILPLLDRGVIYAFAHIRGGGEMGRTWYESAKYKTKKITFTDFIRCAEHLIDTGLTSSSKMTCEGRSAGGLLIGAVLNMRPDLFTAALAGVPFVDVMNTMSDATIPLTTSEWEEWGNPNELDFFHYMLSYSPYENIKKQAYPNILVTSGLYDPRVMYWEPTKYVAKLRDTKSDSNEVLLKMDMASGHFSASDRYNAMKEKAFEYAFLLQQLKSIRGKSEKTSLK